MDRRVAMAVGDEEVGGAASHETLNRGVHLQGQEFLRCKLQKARRFILIYSNCECGSPGKGTGTERQAFPRQFRAKTTLGACPLFDCVYSLSSEAEVVADGYWPSQ